ncbi:MAG: biotin--[acetyl-CoA-carboxylase] ligase, partial [Saprospiraceae bacterium]
MLIDQIPHHQLAGFLRLLSLSKKISPASLTKELDLTHAEASKTIENFLKLDNFLIEKEKTISSISPLELLDSSKIKEEINSFNQQNKNLIYAHHIVSESTSTVAAKLLNHSESNVLVSSDFQTKGKGQRGKHWIANPGSSLLFSVGLKAIKKEYFQRNLSLCIGVIIHKYLASIGASNIYLKWPNDIYFGERKLCGILVENTFYEDTNNCVVGIGINKHPFKLGQEQVAGINELLLGGLSSEKILSDLT